MWSEIVYLSFRLTLIFFFGQVVSSLLTYLSE